MPTSEYFRKKLQIKYGDHLKVGQIYIRRISNILSKLDEELDGLTFNFNKNYIKIEKLNPSSEGLDTPICAIDFNNQEARIFYNLTPREFVDFDQVRHMERFKFSNFQGPSIPTPFYSFDNYHISGNDDKRDEYFVEVAIAVHDHLVKTGY
jgi:hypothetical protein